MQARRLVNMRGRRDILERSPRRLERGPRRLNRNSRRSRRDGVDRVGQIFCRVSTEGLHVLMDDLVRSGAQELVAPLARLVAVRPAVELPFEQALLDEPVEHGHHSLVVVA